MDNWNHLVNDDFETTFPITTSCVVQDKSNDGYERFWGKDSFKYSPYITGTHAIWPARGGANGVNPATNNYPANLESWLVCGPYDFTYAKESLVQFTLWYDITDPNDYFSVGFSTNGQDFAWTNLATQRNSWTVVRFWNPFLEGRPQVWVALRFHSENHMVDSKGVWVDDLKIWRHNNAVVTCGDRDPGNKGVVMEPYESVGGG